MIKIEHKDLSRNIMDLSAVQGDSGYINVGITDYILAEGDRVTLTIGDKMQSFVDKDATFEDDNVAQFFLSASDLNLDEGQYYYDIRLIKSNNEVECIIRPSVFLIIGKAGGDSD